MSSTAEHPRSHPHVTAPAHRAVSGWNDYATRWSKRHGGFDPRLGSPLVRGWLWLAYRSARLLVPLRVAPSTVTAAGVLLAAAVPALAAPGGAWPVLGAALVALGALADSVDGALALVADRETRLGRLYDSVADRLTEAAWLGGLWVLGAPGWLLAGCGALAWLHEYVRARAAVAGLRGIGVVTVSERPTRVLVVAFGLALSGLAGLVGPDLAAGTATVAAAIWAVLSGLGLAQLAVAVRGTLQAVDKAAENAVGNAADKAADNAAGKAAGNGSRRPDQAGHDARGQQDHR